MPQQYYTLEQAARILRLDAEKLKEMARKKEIRAFQDRSGWRFRAQEIDEMARERGYGSDPELPLGEAGKAKAGDSAAAKDVFNFSLDADGGDEVALGKDPAASKASGTGSGSRKSGASKSPPKASSDSDVRLVLEGSDVDFSIRVEDSKAPVSPPPKVGSSSKSRMGGPVKDESGARIVPLDKPSDSDVKIRPSSPQDSDVASGKQSAKKPSDSDIRIEEMPRGGTRHDPIVTEEIDLDAEQRKAEAARAKRTKHRPKPGSSPILPTTSPFELSENDIDVDGPTIPPAAAEAKDDTDSSSDFDLKPMGDSSSPLDIGSDDEVSLGELTGGKGASGINLQEPADSGISLEPESSEEMDLQLNLEQGSTPKPAPAKNSETDSSSDFELSLQDEDASPTDEGSSSEFELNLQEDDAAPSDEGSSSEFELSLDEGAGLAVEEGSSDLGLETPGSDSDSEFELSLDESGGLSVEEEEAGADENVFETDFEVPSLDEESGSEAVALDEADTDLESSEFDLSVEGEDSGSQVVPLEDEEEYDEGAATVQRPAVGLEEEGAEDLGAALDEDLEQEPALEEEEEVEAAAVAAAPAPPAEWGALPALVLMPCTIILFLACLMGFELIQGMWGYHTGNKTSNLIVHPIAKMFDDSLKD
jgi:excisionase family DNA binding protein